MSQVESENLTSWLKDTFAVINKGGRLAPAKTSQKAIAQLFEQANGEKFLHAATIFGYSQSDRVRCLARDVPDLADKLRTEEGQRAIDKWFEQNAEAVTEFSRQIAPLLKQLPATSMISFAEHNKEDGSATDRKGKRGKRGPLSEADLGKQLWHALKNLKDPYKLDESRLAHIKQVEVLAQQRQSDSAFAGGEVLGDILSTCVKHIAERANLQSVPSRCCSLIAEIAKGSSLATVSQHLGLRRETVSREYRPKAINILTKEFTVELNRRIRTASSSQTN